MNPINRIWQSGCAQVLKVQSGTRDVISEFGNSLYTNVTFGWSNLFIQDLPGGGGPNYPLATPGARLNLTPTDQIALLAAIFNGDPAGAGFTGLQEIKDPAGINFRLKDPPFVIGEAQYKYNQETDSQGLAGAIKFGGWYHFGPFDDNHFGIDGRSLADPLSNGRALVHLGDFGVYGVIDQMLWRLPGDRLARHNGVRVCVATFRGDDRDAVTPIRHALRSRRLCNRTPSLLGAVGPCGRWGRSRAGYDPPRPAAQHRSERKAGLGARHSPAGRHTGPYHGSRKTVSGSRG
jgi:hypothetical protein